LEHLLIAEFEKSSLEFENEIIMSEFIPDESCTIHLWLKSKLPFLCDDTEKVIGITRIVLAMWYLYSQDIIHRDLNLTNIPFNCDSIIWIFNFNCRILINESWNSLQYHRKWNNIPEINCYYTTLEVFESEARLQCNIFLFVLILYEILVNNSWFSEIWTTYQIMKKFVMNNEHIAHEMKISRSDLKTKNLVNMRRISEILTKKHNKIVLIQLMRLRVDSNDRRRDMLDLIQMGGFCSRSPRFLSSWIH
jgi:serine/threonine protein kinase